MKEIQQSASYTRAKDKAEEYLNDKNKLSRLFFDASRKADRLKTDRHVSSVWSELHAILRMMRAFIRGSYRAFPTCSLLLIIAGLLYFVWPLDFSPDAVPLLGMLDDVTLLAWIIRSVRGDVEEFRRWESAEPFDPAVAPTTIDAV